MTPRPERTERLVSRRRVIQGGVAAGVVMSAPVFPFRPFASANEMELVSEPIDLSAAVPAANPTASLAAPSAPSLRALSTDSLRTAATETDTFGTVGVSWDGGAPEGASVRVRRNGAWGDWQALHVDPSHGPDPSEAAPSARRVSEPLWVGAADAYELVVPSGAGNVVLHRVRETHRPVVSAEAPSADAAPWITPRSSWGAAPYNGTPSYAQPQLAIVHHSAGTNDYGQGDVAGIIRGMQRYHQEGNGWNDIAYNFLVDKWGRIWEGRAGGVAEGVIGGHTYGCNTGTIGICYVGNLTAGVAMPQAAAQSIAALISWKFNRVHNIDPRGTCWYAPVASDPSRSKYEAGVGDWHPTIVGHRHFGKTECPGTADSSVVPAIYTELTRLSDVRGISPSLSGSWSGTWLVTGPGQAYPHGWMPYHGSMVGEHLNAPMINLAPTPDGGGYWMLGADGGIFTFGNARFHGSTGAMRLNKPVVGMAATKSGKGYWLVASDGGLFAFGDAGFYGSMGGRHLNQPVIGMARTASGRGYWLFATDGGIFAFGDAGFFGSAGGGALPSPAVGVASHPDGRGYWLALANGTVRAFGNVPHLGNAAQPSSDPVVGISSTPDGGGYWLVARSGKVLSFGNAS